MRNKKTIAWFLSVITALLLWQVVSSGINYPQLIPSVSGLVLAVVHLITQSSFYIALGATILRGVIGAFMAFLLALPIGFLCGKKSFWFHYFNPLLSTLRSTPVIAFILLIILWLPTEVVAPVIALITMFPVLCENVIKGVQSINPDYEKLSAVFQINFRTKARYIYWPSLKPFIESGSITAFGFGWKAIIMGEVLSKPFAGIGVEMRTAQMFINVPDLIAWTLVAIIVSFLLTETLRSLLKIQRKALINHGQSRQSIDKTIASAIQVNQVTKQYGTKKLFENLTLTIPENSICMVTGASGKGKTTLLDILAGATQSDEGSISGNKTRKAYLFQTPMLLPWLNAKENILLTAPKVTSASDITKLLESLEITGISNNYPDQMSGGQKQRVALARALAAEPQLLLVDEPFTGLNKALQEKIASLLVSWTKDRNATLIIAIHETTPMIPFDMEIAL